MPGHKRKQPLASIADAQAVGEAEGAELGRPDKQDPSPHPVNKAETKSASHSGEYQSGDEDDESMIDVSFDFQDPKPIDYHGIKTLLSQTFPPTDPGTGVIHAGLGALADAIIAQAQVGSIVKVDGDSDPYALCTVVEAHAPAVAPVLAYVQAKAAAAAPSSTGAARISTLLQPGGDQRLAFLFNERLINMPPQIVPPLLRMLLEEMQWAQEDGKTDVSGFDYFVLISKLYHEVESTVEAEMAADEEGAQGDLPAPQPRGKKRTKRSLQAFHFQPEDELLEQLAEATFDYRLPTATSSDARRVFQECGIEPFRRVLLLPAAKLSVVLEQLERSF